MASIEIRVGCSGWQYRHWRGGFYPAELPARRWFEHYAATFDTVEINNTFYRLPDQSVFEEWRRQAPPGFRYAVKASRYLTHMKKLKEPVEPLERILGRARHLGPTLGPVLYQLPPRWRYNRERIAAFLDLLPRDILHVLELREESWYNEELFALLEARGVSYCAHDMVGLPPERRATGPIAYARFHGIGTKYGGSYAEEDLRPWAEWLLGEGKKGRSIHAYFNNDIGGHAIDNALTLRTMLTGR